MNSHWDKEDFEDKVALGIIGMYETKLKKYKNDLKISRVTPEIFNNLRRVGCYFTPSDRAVLVEQTENKIASRIQTLDMQNETLPEHAVHCIAIPNSENDPDSMRSGAYLEIYFLKRLPSLPKPMLCDISGRAYRLTMLWMKNNYMEGVNQYLVMNKKGEICNAHWFRQEDFGYGKRKTIRIDDQFCQSVSENGNAESLTTVSATATTQIWNDRSHLWNVQAKEGVAKASFGVYPEQIKSLFYARSLPMSETGRKRPILHWVNSHTRRLKKGIDIDIEKHLRGCNEFVFNGTQFKITNPLKKATK